MFTEKDLQQIAAHGLTPEAVEHQIENFRRGRQPGMEVVTSGGIYGKIKEINGNVVVLEVAHNVNVRVDISVVFANPGAMNEEGK